MSTFTPQAFEIITCSLGVSSVSLHKPGHLLQAVYTSGR